MKNNYTNIIENLITFNSPLPSHLPDLRKLWKEAFGDSDKFLDLFYTTAYSDDRCRIATINDNVVAALYWFNCKLNEKPVAYIYAVATAAELRGQGICHALMEDTHAHMKALGYATAILSPADERLNKFYEGIGYKTCSNIHEFTCEGLLSHDYKNISIRKVDKHEYSNIRRRLLPPNGIIQENENLDFLETQAEFYTGDDFLLVADGDDDVLNGIELLGNIDNAKAIVSALGYKRGRFRTPGSDKPFAMYLPLSVESYDITQKDIYIGFVFD